MSSAGAGSPINGDTYPSDADAGRHNGSGTDTVLGSDEQRSNEASPNEGGSAPNNEKSTGEEHSERPVTPESFEPGSRDTGPTLCNHCLEDDREYHHTPLWRGRQAKKEAEAMRSRSRTRSKSRSGQRSRSRTLAEHKSWSRSSSPLRKGPSDSQSLAGTVLINPPMAVPTTPHNSANTGDALADLGKLPANWADDDEDEEDTSVIVTRGREAGFNTLTPEMLSSLKQGQTADSAGRRDSATSPKSYFSDTTVDSDEEQPVEGGSGEQDGSSGDPTNNEGDDAANSLDDSLEGIAMRLLGEPSLPPRRTRSLSPTATTRSAAVDEAIEKALFTAEQHCDREKAALERQLYSLDRQRGDEVVSFEAIKQKLRDAVAELTTDREDFFKQLANLTDKEVANYIDAADCISEKHPGVSNRAFRDVIIERDSLRFERESLEGDLAQVTQERDNALECIKEQIVETEKFEQMNEQQAEEYAEVIQRFERELEERNQTIATANDQHERDVKSLEEANRKVEEANRQLRLRDEMARDARIAQDRVRSEHERIKEALRRSDLRARCLMRERDALGEKLWSQTNENEHLTKRMQALEALSKDPRVDLVLKLQAQVETLEKPTSRETTELGSAMAKIRYLEKQLNAAAYALSSKTRAGDKPIFDDSKCDESATEHRATIHSLEEAKRKANQQLGQMTADLQAMEGALQLANQTAARIRNNEDLKSIYDKFSRASDALERSKKACAARDREIIKLREHNQRLQDSSERSTTTADRRLEQNQGLLRQINSLESQLGPREAGSKKSRNDLKRFWKKAPPEERTLRAQELIDGLHACARTVDTRHYDLVRIHRSRDDKVKFHLQRKKPQHQACRDTVTAKAAAEMKRKSEETDEELDKVIRDADEWQKELKSIRSKWPLDPDYVKRPWAIKGPSSPMTSQPSELWTEPPKADVDEDEPPKSNVDGDEPPKGGVNGDKPAKGDVNDSDEDSDYQRALAASLVDF